MTSKRTPFEHIPANEHHGHYITDNMGNSVCDLYRYDSDDGKVAFEFENAAANAAHIVKCVNLHERLVDGLKAISNSSDSTFCRNTARDLLAECETNNQE